MRSIKQLLHKTILLVETFADRTFNKTGKGRFIDAYIGYSTPEHIILRGRVLSKLRHAIAADKQSKFTNFRQIFRMFLTDEVRDVTVCCGSIQTKSDEEGYFTLHLPRDNRVGWSVENVYIQDHDKATPCPVFVPSSDAEFMVISDIDDTVLKTGAYSLIKNLFTSFTGNALTRQVFPDALDLIQELSANGQNPIYYVSSSPWNIHDFLADIFENTGLIRGPMFLRDLGFSKTKFITEGHGNHKGNSIDKILAATPNLPAILLGDTGQHDAQIYQEVIERHPGRILFVGLRTPGKGLDAADRRDLEALDETRVAYMAEKQFDGFLERIRTVEKP